MRMTMTVVLGALVVAFLLFQPSSTEAATRQLSERTYKQLSRAYELMEDGRVDEAITRLDKLRPRVARKPYEHALLLQTYGYLYTRTDQYEKAIDALTKSVALKALPGSETKHVLYLLAQLQMAVADYPAAVVSVEQWLLLEKHPTPGAFALAGSAYGHARRYPEAVKLLTKALALAENPEENWYRQLLAVYYESEQYRAAASLLQKMISRFPENAEYWLQLSSVYRALENDAQSIAVMELAYQRGLLAREPELLTLARYYLYMELPDKAGQLLEKGLRQGVVRPTKKNWRLLIDAWTRARELNLALAAIERGLDATGDVNLHLRRARLLAEQEDWPQVVVALEAALATEGLASPGQAHFLQGIAHYHLQQPRKAVSSFEQARAYDDSKGQAGQWIEHVTATLRFAAAEYSSRDFSPAFR